MPLFSIIYDISLKLFGLAIRIASVKSEKAHKWLNGRKNVFSSLKEQIPTGSRTIWMHCASLGEFEQGRPLLELIKKNHPDEFIVLTFFSPSGYEVRKNYEYADVVSYLPIDSKGNAKDFLEIVNPKLAINVKYDLWYHYLSGLKNRKIPSILVSAIMNESKYYFKSYGKPMLDVLKGFDLIAVQDTSSQQLLSKYSFDNVLLTGDTRVDRVGDIVNNKRSFDKIERFLEGEKAIVIGSAWKEDVELALPFLKGTVRKVIVAPHNIGAAFLKYIESVCSSTIRFTSANEKEGSQVLILDTIGMLSEVYQYADIAYIGGGLKTGLHNCLEPMAYSIPVLFGTKFRNFPEAVFLEDSGAGKSVSTSHEFEKAIKYFSSANAQRQSAEKIHTFFEQSKGATQKVYTHIKPYL